MKKHFKILSTITFILLISSCATQDSRNFPWAGVYTGMIPSASGPGINVTLTLNASSMTYELHYNYVDRSTEVFVFNGRFTWNAATNIITLDIANFPPYYEAGDGILTQLDLAGRRITGDLAGNYVLRKMNP